MTRGDPIIYFEIDYNVTAESDDKPSQYQFNFSKIRVINTVSGKVTQISSLNKVQPRTMTPAQDLREFAGIVAKEKEEFAVFEKYIAKGLSFSNAMYEIAYNKELMTYYQQNFVKIPGKNLEMMKTEVTQKLYTEIMDSNPSYFKGDTLPVENVSWYDAIYFCNKLSEKYGLTPVYAVYGVTDVTKWDYTPHNGNSIRGTVTQNDNANGFRLPTMYEWKYAAKGGQNYTYAGSNNLDEVGWYDGNSEDKTHPVAQKKANGYGLYDMSGNVCEWCWDALNAYYNYYRGGSYYNGGHRCEVVYENDNPPSGQYDYLGFRVVCSPSK